MANIVDRKIVVSKFEIQSFTFGLIPLGKVWTLYSPLTTGLIVPVLFNKDGFVIKLPTKVYIPLKQRIQAKTKENEKYQTQKFMLLIYLFYLVKRPSQPPQSAKA